MSMYSVASSAHGGSRNINSASQQSSQVSTTTLLNAIHTIYTSSQPYRLDASSSLVVNTWLSASQVDQDGRTGGTVDATLAARAWEHARRRAEDGCIVLGSVNLKSITLEAVLISYIGPYTIPRLQFSHHSYQHYHFPFHPLYIQLSMLSDHSFSL